MTVADPPPSTSTTSTAEDRSGRERPRARHRPHRPPTGPRRLRGVGDLAGRKLLPAIAALTDHGVLPPGFTVVGVARTTWCDEEFRKVALKAVDKPSPAWKEMVRRFRYVSGEYGHPDTFDALKKILDEADTTLGTAGNRIFYLATIPDLFGTVATALGKHGCATPEADVSPDCWWRSPSAATWPAPRP